MSTAEAARGRALYFAIAIAVLFLGIAAFNFWTSRDNLREGSKQVSGGGPAMRITHVPTTYRATFRIENRGGGVLVPTTEKIWVRRPFASRIETFRQGSGDKPSTVRQSAFGVLTNRSVGASEPLNVAAPPSLASGDLRVDSVLKEVVAERDWFRRERREVYGRECQVYRAGGPVFAGDITPFVAGKQTYTDVCIDRNGIVIEEYWVTEDKLVRRRVATDVEVDVAIPRSTFTIDVPENPRMNRGAVQKIDSNAPIEADIPFWTLPKTPDGFESLGRYAVIISPDAVPQLGNQPSVAPTSTTDVFVRGPDLVVIDQDPSLAGPVAMQDRTTEDIELGRLREGKLVVDARMSEVYGHTPDGSFVRVIGTLPTSQLIELARSLRPAQTQ